MQGAVGNGIGTTIGQQIGAQIAARIAAEIRDAMAQGITQGGAQARAASTRQGGEAGGAFGRTFRTRVEAALRSLPDITIGANTSEADADIRALRVQLETLATQRVGIDVDAETARRQIDELERELTRLGAASPDINVRINVRAATAQLAALRADIARLDGQDVDIDADVDTSRAITGFSNLTTVAVGLGPAIIPVLATVGAGLGAIASAGVSAAAGVGAVALVAIPAFKQIGSALQAQKAAQDAATQSTGNGAAAAVAAQQRAIQMATATQGLATAERNGARQIATAQEGVTKARQNAASVAAQASQRTQAAARAVQDAEKQLVSAQKDAVRAQQDLTTARKDAAQQLQDMNDRLAGSALDERAAVLRVREAQDELTKSQAAGSKATQLDRDQAQLAYDQAVQGLKDQQKENARLKTETAAANKAGVEGSDTVLSAQDRLSQAKQHVADQAVAVRDAEAAQSRQAVQNAQDVAEAQGRIVEAQKSVAVAQQSAADSVASAQRQIQSAQMSSATGSDAAATAQAKYRAELAKLTPSARDTMTAFTGLKTAFSGWSRSLQPQVMPIFTLGLNTIRKILPQLTPLVVAASGAVMGLMRSFASWVEGGGIKRVVAWLSTTAGSSIRGFGQIVANIFSGIGGILRSFAPSSQTVVASLVRLTARFREWGQSGTGVRSLLAYVRDVGPTVGEFFKNAAITVGRLVQALAPLGGVSLMVINMMARLTASIPLPVLKILTTVVAGAIVGLRLYALTMTVVAAAQKAWTIAQTVFNAVMSLSPLTIIIIAIIAFAAAVVIAYKKSETFRAIVQAAWAGIQAGAKAVIGWFSGPFKRFFTVTIPGVFNTVINWVKKNWPWILGALTGPIGLAVVYIVKHWDQVRAGLSAGWNWIKKWVISPIQDFFTKKIPGWAGTLKNRVVEAFESAATGLGKAWGKIQELAKKPVKFVIDQVYNKGIVKTWNLIASAFGAPPLAKMPLTGWATGGVLPGYTPGRDVHRFVSPTGGRLDLSGGEAIMRPEFTRAVGGGFVNTLNKIATTRGANGVKAALAPALGGNPLPSQQFKDGGIFGWIGKAASGVGSKAWDGIKKGASWLTDGLESSARAGVSHVVDPLLKRFPGADTGFGKMIRRIPTKIIDSLFGYSKKADAKGAGGIGGPKIQTALKWVKTQAGLPYQWAGNGSPSWDCSGLMSAIESVIRGEKPHRRWATGSFSGKQAPPGWVLNGKSPFQIGITNAGVGHTAGTLGGTNVESRGGAGVVVGPHARGWNDPLFGSHYGFMPGKFDSGGYLQPGMNLAYNGTGKPEPVLTTQQLSALTGRAGSQGPGDVNVKVFVGSEEISKLARVEITHANHELMQVLNAGGGN
ncbi:hypothetical protein [Streptomyces sp. AcH 505]|uniref:hypothetical protein n=1 Tax=Streptomyces sp. AcH 505 TaxID=352211 RepID=UPI0006936A54